MYYAFWTSPIGTLYVEASDIAVKKITIIDAKDVHKPNASEITDQCIQEFEEYFSDQRKTFDVPVDFSGGTIFQKKVWQQLLNIPYGSTTSYLAIAKAIHNPLSVRAVGMANGKNPIPIIVPCHRVIGSNGSLVGYALGVEVKQQLLKLENPIEFGQQVKLF